MNARNVGMQGWSERFRLRLGTCLICCIVPVLGFLSHVPGLPQAVVAITFFLAPVAFIACLGAYVLRLYRGEVDYRRPMSKRETWAFGFAAWLVVALNALHLFQVHFR